MKFFYNEVNTPYLNRTDKVYLYAVSGLEDPIQIAEKSFRNDSIGKKEKREYIRELRNLGIISYEQYVIDGFK